jgi:hypothetical protein
MARRILRDFILGPGVMTAGLLDFRKLDIGRRDQILTDAIRDKPAHCLPEIALCHWLLVVDDVLQCRGVHHGDTLVAVFGAEGFEDGAEGLLG